MERKSAIIYSDYLIHSGTKGMKWGIRNGPPYPINRNQIITEPKKIYGKARNGVIVHNISAHAKEQMQVRKVTSENIKNAFTKPLFIDKVKYNKRGEPSMLYVGEFSSVAINPDNGIITTVWRTGKKTVEKYRKEGNKHVYYKGKRSY